MYTAAILFVLGSMHWRRSSVMLVSVLMCCVPSSAAWACYQAHSVVLTVSRQLLSLPLPRQRSRLAGSRTDRVSQPVWPWHSVRRLCNSDGGARRRRHSQTAGPADESTAVRVVVAQQHSLVWPGVRTQVRCWHGAYSVWLRSAAKRSL